MAAPSSSSAATQLWYPPPTKDANLDLALQTAFQQIYGVQQQSLQAVSPGAAGASIASGITQVTGSQNGIATGLATVSRIVASIDAGDAPLIEFVSAQVAPTNNGIVNIFVWTMAGAASTTPQSVHWIAYGTPKPSQRP